MTYTHDRELLFTESEIKACTGLSKVNTHKLITEQLHATYKAKNADYGDAFGITYEKYGAISALTRISDKFNRIESLMLSGERFVDDEKITDTLLDMANYCIMTVMEIQKGENK